MLHSLVAPFHFPVLLLQDNDPLVAEAKKAASLRHGNGLHILGVLLDLGPQMLLGGYTVALVIRRLRIHSDTIGMAGYSNTAEHVRRATKWARLV